MGHRQVREKCHCEAAMETPQNLPTLLAVTSSRLAKLCLVFLSGLCTSNSCFSMTTLFSSE